MDRYFSQTLKGGRGFPTIHVVYDRAVHPPYPKHLRKTAAAARKLARELTADAGPWVVPAPMGHEEEYRRFLGWARQSPAMNSGTVPTPVRESDAVAA